MITSNMVSSGDNEAVKTDPATLSLENNSTTRQADDAIILDESHRVENTDSETTVTSKARQSANALKDLIMTLASKTKETAVAKTQELKDVANDERPEFEKDAADIHRLGSLVDGIAENFDHTIDSISQAPYEEQTRLLQAFKKLLNEEINVINARHSMATRLAFTSEDLRGQALKAPDQQVL